MELCVHIFTRESPCEEISVDLKRRSTYHFIPFNTQRFFYSFNNNIILKKLKRSIESLRACVSGATCCICGMFFFDNFFSLLKFITLSCSAKILNNFRSFWQIFDYVHCHPWNTSSTLRQALKYWKFGQNIKLITPGCSRVSLIFFSWIFRMERPEKSHRQKKSAFLNVWLAQF